MSSRMEDDCGRAIGVWVEGAQHRDFSHMEWLSPDVYGLDELLIIIIAISVGHL